MPKEQKSTRAEIDKRINAVKDMFLNGFTRAQMFQYVSAKYNVTTRQFDNYSRIAQNEIVESTAKDKAEALQRTLERREGLYRKFMMMKDYRAASNELTKIEALFGLHVQKHEITQTFDWTKISDDAKRASEIECEKVLSETILSLETPENLN